MDIVFEVCGLRGFSDNLSQAGCKENGLRFFGPAKEFHGLLIRKPITRLQGESLEYKPARNEGETRCLLVNLIRTGII
jgi:hypothetical protein